MNDKCVVLNAKKMNFDGKLDFSVYLNMRNLKISGKIVMISACQYHHIL